MAVNKTLLISLSLLMSISWYCAEASEAEAQHPPRVSLPPQDSPQYWVLRAEAVREGRILHSWYHAASFIVGINASLAISCVLPAL